MSLMYLVYLTGLENDPRSGIEDYPDGMCDTMTHDRKNDYSKLLRTKCNRTIQVSKSLTC